MGSEGRGCSWSTKELPLARSEAEASSNELQSNQPVNCPSLGSQGCITQGKLEKLHTMYGASLLCPSGPGLSSHGAGREC